MGRMKYFFFVTRDSVQRSGRYHRSLCSRDVVRSTASSLAFRRTLLRERDKLRSYGVEINVSSRRENARCCSLWWLCVSGLIDMMGW